MIKFFYDLYPYLSLSCWKCIWGCFCSRNSLLGGCTSSLNSSLLVLDILQLQILSVLSGRYTNGGDLYLQEGHIFLNRIWVGRWAWGFSGTFGWHICFRLIHPRCFWLEICLCLEKEPRVLLCRFEFSLFLHFRRNVWTDWIEMAPSMFKGRSRTNQENILSLPLGPVQTDFSWQGCKCQGNG